MVLVVGGTVRFGKEFCVYQTVHFGKQFCVYQTVHFGKQFCVYQTALHQILEDHNLNTCPQVILHTYLITH